MPCQPIEGFNLVGQHLVAGFGVSVVGRGSPAVSWHTLAHTSARSMQSWRWGTGRRGRGSKAGAWIFVSVNTCQLQDRRPKLLTKHA